MAKDKRQKDIDAEQNWGEKTTEPVSLDPDAEKAAIGDRDKSTQELEGDGGRPGDTEVLAGDRREQNQIVSGIEDLPEPKPYAAVNLERVDAVFSWNGLGRHPDQPDNTEAIEIPEGVAVTVGTVYDRDNHEFITRDEADRRRNPDRRDEEQQA